MLHISGAQDFHAFPPFGENEGSLALCSVGRVARSLTGPNLSNRGSLHTWLHALVPCCYNNGSDLPRMHLCVCVCVRVCVGSEVQTHNVEPQGGHMVWTRGIELWRASMVQTQRADQWCGTCGAKPQRAGK